MVENKLHSRLDSYFHMKFAVDFTYIKNKPYSGTFQMGFAILECLHNSGIDCIALVSGSKDYNYLVKQGYSAKLVDLPDNRILRNISRLFYFVSNHKRYKDIIYTGSFNPIFWLRKGTILVHDFYIIDIPHAYDWLQRIFYKFVVMNSIRLAENCITTTRINKKRVHGYFPSLKNVFLYSLMQDFNSCKKKTDLNINVVEILLVLTTSPNKRWHILLEQALLLSQDNPNRYIFHLVTPQKDFFEKQINDNYAGLNITIHSNISQRKIIDLYHQVHFFWSASIIEGFGMPVRLATLANTEVIAPDTSVNRESSCGLGHYYDAEEGDIHARITKEIVIRGINEYESKLFNEINNIKNTNKRFIHDYLTFHNHNN